MGDLIFQGLLAGAAVVFFVAFFRRLLKLPISQRNNDTRVRLYGVLFAGSMLLWELYQLAQAILDKLTPR